ncbi:hypothetical protein JB92DRAFT_2890113 [Gautieria morchelliformis]|nr:hypothetical protein JB92DRAFT_2890113 [Gautieria morchelliformis]
MQSVRALDESVSQIRERMIWGDVSDSVPKVESTPSRHREIPPKDDEDDILEMGVSSSPRGHKRRHGSSPSRSWELDEGSILSPPGSLCSPSTLSSPRRRPRGSEAGKSIHKAAETPQNLLVSPGSSLNQRLDGHLSLSVGRGVILPAQRRASRIVVSASPNVARKSAVTSPPKTTSGRSGKKTTNNYLKNDHRLRQPVISYQESDGSSSLGKEQPQVARKSAHRGGKNLKTPTIETSHVLEGLSKGAARKYPSKYLTRDSPEVFPTSSSGDSSDSDSLSSSSDLSKRSTPSPGHRVQKLGRGGGLSSGSHPVFTSKLPPGSHPLSSPKGKVTPSGNRSGVGPHHHDEQLNSSSSSKRFPRVNSHDAQMDDTGNSPSVVGRTYRGKTVSPSPYPEIRSKKSASPARSSSLDVPIGQTSSSHEDQHFPASSTPRPQLLPGTCPPFPDTAEAAPPQPLVDAFEELFVYPLYLHRTNRLPFLLRNVRVSFQAWCRDLDIRSKADADSESASHLMPLTYEYISPLGELHTYTTTHPRRECPLCCIFGVFSSWEALRKHFRWDHKEIECELILTEVAPRLVVRMKEQIRAPPSLVVSSRDVLSTSPKPIQAPPLQDAGHDAQTEAHQHHAHSPRRPCGNFTPSRSLSLYTSVSQKVVTSEAVSVFPSHTDPDAGPEPCSIRTPLPQVLTPPIASSPRLTIPTTSPRSKPPTPPPIHNPHGPAHPILVNPDHPLTGVQPVTYRPTGPHLYDHLSTLPVEVFGHQSWFVLDKEEEIFELTDVLDEDKMLCALWGRWILLNRSFFIGNYLAGVEAFVDEYWLIIHQAAGWGALRAFLMVCIR